MRVEVVSDIHGNVADLARVAGSSEVLVVLGDLLDYVDYYDPGRGVLGTIFGAEAVGKLVGLRKAGDFDAFHSYDRYLWSTLADPLQALDDVVAGLYGQVVSALADCPAVYLTLGNVDVEHVWRAVAPPRLRCLDGEVIEIDGIRLGFVGGGAVKTPPAGSPWQSFDRDYQTFADRLVSLGSDYDVLCTHVPPKIPDLRFDTVAQRMEMYGPGLVEAIDRVQPRLALSGHIHHPRKQRVDRGRTPCVNVGYFKRKPTPFSFETEDLR